MTEEKKIIKLDELRDLYMIGKENGGLKLERYLLITHTYYSNLDALVTELKKLYVQRKSFVFNGGYFTAEEMKGIEALVKRGLELNEP